jgi:hypothetical protein
MSWIIIGEVENSDDQVSCGKSGDFVDFASVQFTLRDQEVAGSNPVTPTIS